MTEALCQYCGKPYNLRGIGNHERYCRSIHIAESDRGSDQTGDQVSAKVKKEELDIFDFDDWF